MIVDKIFTVLDDNQEQQEEDTSEQQKLELYIAKILKENKRLKDKVQKMTNKKDVLKKNCMNLTKEIAERESKIEELEMQLTSTRNAAESSWIKDLVDSKQELSEKIQKISTEIEELNEKYALSTKLVEVKTDEVEVLQKRIKVLEDERRRFVDAKEETYSALVQELFKEIEVLSEKALESSMQNEKLRKVAWQTRKDRKIEGKRQEGEHIENDGEQSLAEVVSYDELTRENKFLKEVNQELRGVVEVLEIERKYCITKERLLNETEKADKPPKSLVQENLELRDELQAWIKGFAVMTKKEKMLRAELDMKKKRCASIGRLAKKEMKKLKLVKKRYANLRKRLKMMEGIRRERERLRASPLMEEERVQKEMEKSEVKDGSSDVEERFFALKAKCSIQMKTINDIKEKNEELNELIEFLEMERVCSLEELKEVKNENVELRKKEGSRKDLEEQGRDLESMLKRVCMENQFLKSKFDSLEKNLSDERSKRSDLEVSSKLLEAKYEEVKVKLDDEFQANVALEKKVMEYEVVLQNSKKPKRGFFQKLRRRRK